MMLFFGCLPLWIHHDEYGQNQLKNNLLSVTQLTQQSIQLVDFGPLGMEGINCRNGRHQLMSAIGRCDEVRNELTMTMDLSPSKIRLQIRELCGLAWLTYFTSFTLEDKKFTQKHDR